MADAGTYLVGMYEDAQDMPKLDEEHWHVVEFIDGCLNDYDSGPYDTLEDARAELQQILSFANDGHYVSAGDDRYLGDGIHILKIESCREPREECNRAC